MTPLESLILRYISTHPRTRRRTVIDALGHGELDTQTRVRKALDTLHDLRLITRTGTTRREYRYTTATTS